MLSSYPEHFGVSANAWKFDSALCSGCHGSQRSVQLIAPVSNHRKLFFEKKLAHNHCVPKEEAENAPSKNKQGKEIGSRIGLARRYSGLTQAELAEKLCLTRTQLANLESGRSVLRFGVGLEICKLTNSNQLWLATGEGQWTPFLQLNLREIGIQQDILDQPFSVVVVNHLRSILNTRAKLITDLNSAADPREWLNQYYVDAIESLSKIALFKLSEPLRMKFVFELLENAKTFLKTHSEGLLQEINSSQINSKELNTEGVESNRLNALIAQVQKMVKERGQKSELARFLKVPPQRVHEWLSGEKSPGGEITLQLLEWVKQKEQKEKAPASVTSTHEGKQTLKGKPLNESKSGPSKPH